MTIRVGINGFGRIGRNFFKALDESGDRGFEVVAANDLGDLKTMAHLLKYDTVAGRFDKPVSVEGDSIRVGDQKIKILAERDPANLPWGDLGVDIVVESTGRFTTGPAAKAHIAGGAKKVIISAPAKEEDITIVPGVNDDKYDPANHAIISNASCTTNCLAPVVKVLLDEFGFRRGVMTTVHAYTNDQNILDLPHKDLRRGRAAALSMIPTSTGAAQAVGLVLPELKGKFDGISVRVPTPNVSLVDLTFHTEQATNADEINQVIRDASNGELEGILDYSDEQLVSIDFNHNAHSSIVDTTFTRSVDPHMHKILAWYDNEWGYSNRILDLIAYVARVKKEALTTR